MGRNDISSLTEQALKFLDAGDVDGTKRTLRHLLETQESVTDASTRAALHGYTTERDDPIAHNAMRCLVGSAIPLSPQANVTAHDSHADVWASVIDDERASHSDYFRSLDRLRSYLVDHPDALARSRKLLSFAALLGSPTDSTDETHLPFDVARTQTRNSAIRWIDTLKELLATRRAAARANEQVTLRLIWTAQHAGMTQRQISVSLGVPQSTLYRELKRIEGNPGAISLTPSEILDHHLAGEFDRLTLIGLLAAYPYTAGDFPADAPDWGYVPGSWDQLAKMVASGELSKEEFGVVTEAIESRGRLEGD